MTAEFPFDFVETLSHYHTIPFKFHICITFIKFSPEMKWVSLLKNRSLGGWGGGPNSKGADQPAHPRRLISTFVICLLERVISREISIF